MREIKFRAWDLNEHKMRHSDGRENYTNGTLSDFFHYTDNYAVKLMQFTGLKDKNGKEIYEGDIVQLNNGIRVRVEYREDCFACIDIETDEVAPYLFVWCNDKTVEVMGNIYENPELTKKEGDV